MGDTQFRNKQLNSTAVDRLDMDTVNTSLAVITKVIAGVGISLSSTGVDAGTGDVTISFLLNYVAKTANYSIATTDFLIECTSNTFTLTLPTAVGVTGKMYVLKNSGTGTITVNTTSSQTIDGSLTQKLNRLASITIVSNGSNWILI